MKKYERDLLNSLEGEDILSGEEPLKNVKNALGSLRHVVGNPLFKAEINIHIDSIWYDQATGLNIAPAALPLNFQQPLPLYLFGLTDFWGSYNRGKEVIPIPGMTPMAWLWIPALGHSVSIMGNTVGFAGSAWLAGNGDNGDILLITISNDPVNPTIMHVFRIHCNNVAYSTLLHSMVSELMFIHSVRYIVPNANINQFINPVFACYQNMFGKIYTDSIDPRMYQLPTDFQNQISDIPLNTVLDKQMFFGFLMEFDCPAIDMIFFVEKVEPLTLMQKYVTKR